MCKSSSSRMSKRLGGNSSFRFTLLVLTLSLCVSSSYASESHKFSRIRRGVETLENLEAESSIEALTALAASLADRLPPSRQETVRLAVDGTKNFDREIRNKISTSDVNLNDIGDGISTNGAIANGETKNGVIRIRDVTNDVTSEDRLARLRRLLAFRLQKYSVSDIEGRAGPRFSPWGGKRAEESPLEDVDAFANENKRAFHPWGGKRAYYPVELGWKRKFQPWGGKRGGGLVLNKIFTPWGGK